MERHEDNELRALVQAQAERHTAPSELRERIATSIRQAEASSQRASQSQGWRQWLNMGAAFAMGIVASVSAGYFFSAASAQERLAQEVVASHVRSLMATHLADIASSDRHTVKPWFTGKLDFSPPVHDLAAQGFPLVGGRLDYIGGRPTAALIYQHRQHTINVLVWPRDDRSPTPPAAFVAQGYNVTGWKGEAMQFWLVSELNAGELRQFAQQLRKASEAGS
jgi:anti-sigma factor RsiW